MKEKELEKTQAEIDQLVTIMATNSNAARLNSLISKLEDSEKKLSLLKEETESLKQKLSFGGADCGEKMAEIKKAAEIGTYLGGFLMDDGSSSVWWRRRELNPGPQEFHEKALHT
jgi:hypothetical protein